ncbi:MAG: zinc ribbon domain-containing protein [Bryobacterales bacterium]|nr:zinc ribbon domain-containing protein [Bryobacterales bacterium]
MPIYEYKCSHCGKVYEKRQKFTDPALTICDYCHAEGAVERVVSPPALVFKGSGWYVNDYAKSGNGGGGGKGDSESRHAHSSAGNGSNGSSKADSSASSGDSASSGTASTAASSDSSSKPAAASKSS